MVDRTVALSGCCCAKACGVIKWAIGVILRGPSLGISRSLVHVDADQHVLHSENYTVHHWIDKLIRFIYRVLILTRFDGQIEDKRSV